MYEVPFKTWDYEEQTKMKHIVLHEYIDKWIKIVGHHYPLNYIDCCSGIGAYKDKSGKIFYGSPVIVAQVVDEIKKQNVRNVKLIIIDEKKENIENIKIIFEYLKLKATPEFITDDFDKAINEILDKNGNNLPPTFFFVDPFGFSIKMSTIKRIMSVNKSEVFLNFMFDHLNRFLNLSTIEPVIDELFGNSEWKIFLNKNGIEREDGIREFYRKQLKTFAQWVCSYKLEFPEKKRTYYYLFHLTNHIKGCSIMKSSFATHNLGRVEYQGYRGESLGLFEGITFKVDEVKDLLKNEYYNKSVTYKTILEDNIDSCPFLEGDFYKALKELESNNEIKIVRNPAVTPTGKKRSSIKEQDIIGFNLIL